MCTNLAEVLLQHWRPLLRFRPPVRRLLSTFGCLQFRGLARSPKPHALCNFIHYFYLQVEGRNLDQVSGHDLKKVLTFSRYWTNNNNLDGLKKIPRKQYQYFFKNSTAEKCVLQLLTFLLENCSKGSNFSSINESYAWRVNILLTNI